MSGKQKASKRLENKLEKKLEKEWMRLMHAQKQLASKREEIQVIRNRIANLTSNAENRPTMQPQLKESSSDFQECKADSGNSSFSSSSSSSSSFSPSSWNGQN